MHVCEIHHYINVCRIEDFLGRLETREFFRMSYKFNSII